MEDEQHWIFLQTKQYLMCSPNFKFDTLYLYTYFDYSEFTRVWHQSANKKHQSGLKLVSGKYENLKSVFLMIVVLSVVFTTKFQKTISYSTRLQKTGYSIPG